MAGTGACRSGLTAVYMIPMRRYPAVTAAMAILLACVAATASAGGRNEPARPQPAPVSEPDGPDTGLQLDPETVALLADMGMMAFEQRIPSEDFSLPLLGGGEMTLAEHAGSVVFLNFWATWCPPCREEMPSMQVLYDELREEGLAMIAVNVLEDEATARAFIEEFGFTYPVPLDRNGRVMLRYGVRAYPTTYIIDRTGHVIGVRPGYHDWATDEVIAAMRSLLSNP